MAETTFITLRDDFTADEWPDGEHLIETLVEGTLADRIRKRAGLDGEVIIHEFGVEGGYSEYTVEWNYEFRVEVGGKAAFASDYEYTNVTYPEPAPYERNGLTKMLEWLDESPA